VVGDSQLGKEGGGEGGGGISLGAFSTVISFRKWCSKIRIFLSFYVIIFGKCYFHRMLMI
jgi:hypothetical protein